MRYYKIGFHTGPGGNRNGIGDYFIQLDEEGIPATLVSVDDYGPCYELDNLARISGVPHVNLYRISEKIPGFNADVPDYSLPPDQAATVWWNTVRPHLPPELVNGDARERVRLVVGNELDKNKSNWLGYWAYHLAQKMNGDGFKIAAFGWATGEPEYSDWLTPGMDVYLLYCSRSNGMAAVALHEYSLEMNLQHGFPYLIGRFQFFQDALSESDIDPNSVEIYITEFGWTYRDLPPPTYAIDQMRPIVDLYSNAEAVKGAMIWYLGGGFSEIANKAQKLIAPVTQEAVAMGYSPPEDDMVDLLDYYRPALGKQHGPIYMLNNNWGQGRERTHLSLSPTGSQNHYYVSKNARWERRYINDDWIWLQADTSRADDEFYTVSGDAWLPRHMIPGQKHTRREQTKIYSLSGCNQIDGGNLVSDMVFVGYHETLSTQLGFDVIQLNWLVNGVIEERHYLGKHVGLVQWENKRGMKSYLEEFVPPDELPNPIDWSCTILDETLPPGVPPPTQDPLEVRAWDQTVQMQTTGQGGIRLNNAAGIQQQMNRDNATHGLSLQKVTDEIVIEGHTYMAAESLTGACPRRVYHWRAGEPVTWFEDPTRDNEEYLLWPVVNDRHLVNSKFGVPRTYGPHEGIDLYGVAGNLIVASMGGTVVWASNQRRSGGPSAYGNHIIIEHPNGWVTWYCHLASMDVSVGDQVSRNQRIGVIGSTGNSTGIHLHLNLQIPGAGLPGYNPSDVVDPYTYLR